MFIAGGREAIDSQDYRKCYAEALARVFPGQNLSQNFIENSEKVKKFETKLSG